MMGRRRWAKENERGAVALEFALIVPFLLALMFGLIQYAELLWWEATVRYAVEEGARCATLGTAPQYCCALSASYTCGGGNTPSDYAAANAAGLGLTAANFTLSNPSCGMQMVATNVKVNFAVTAMPSISLIGNGTGQFSLAPSACYP